MDAYNGTYYLQGGEEQPATLLFLKDKLSIGLRDEHGNPRVVYWYYDQIVKENFWKGGHATVHYSGHPQQVIEASSKEFTQKLEEIINRKELPFISKVFNKRTAAMWKVAIVLIAVLAATYFFFIPFLATRLASRVPISYEENLGDQMFNAIKQGYKIDAQRTAYINEFFKELKIETPYNIRVTVVNEKVANAFAMPGGNIVVYDKVLAGMKSYEELAALLVHEFTHVHNKHTTKSLFRQLGTSVFFSVLFGDVGSIGGAVVNNADRLKSLSYGRSLEKEADLEGLKLLSDRKIDGNGFVGLFELLKKESTIEMSEWLNSHPNIDNRIKYIRKDEHFNKHGVEKNETLKTLFLKIQTAEWGSAIGRRQSAMQEFQSKGESS